MRHITLQKFLNAILVSLLVPPPCFVNCSIFRVRRAALSSSLLLTVKKGADMLGGLVAEMYARRLSTRDVEVMFIEAFWAARAGVHVPVQRQLDLSYEMSKG